MKWLKNHNRLTLFADLMAKRNVFAALGIAALILEAIVADLQRHNADPRVIKSVASASARPPARKCATGWATPGGSTAKS
jgi:hypothetical protein